MSRRIVLLLTGVAACSPPVRSYPAEHVQRVELSPPAVDSQSRRPAPPAVDLTGPWIHGATNEPAVPRVTLELQCNYTPSIWLIEQRGDTVRSWTNPASRAQGIATPPPPRPVFAEGRIAGTDVTMRSADSRYVLRYDRASGHLRGTLNGAPFWAVRQEIVQARDCIPVP